MNTTTFSLTQKTQLYALPSYNFLAFLYYNYFFNYVDFSHRLMSYN